jgi:hypothetical protein
MRSASNTYRKINGKMALTLAGTLKLEGDGHSKVVAADRTKM